MTTENRAVASIEQRMVEQVDELSETLIKRNAEIKGLLADLRTANYAFADALLALEEIGHKDIADRLRERWADVITACDSTPASSPYQS